MSLKLSGTGLEEEEVLEIIDVPAQASDLLKQYSYEELCGQLAEHIAIDSPPSPELINLNEAVSKWESDHRIGQVKAFPVAASIAITDVCNARCSFCNYTPERVSMQRIDPKQLATLNWLKFSRTLALTAGLGDTFAHPDIDEILELIAEKFPYIKMNFITNASLLKPRAINAIVGRANQMNISLNAARKETYEATMSPLKWDTTIGNLKALRDAKEAAGTDRPKLIASYVLHAHNLDELPELPALLADIGVHKARVNFMIPPAQNGSRPLMTDKDTIQNSPELLKRRIPEFEQACLDHGVDLVMPLPDFVDLSGSRVGIRESSRTESPLPRTTSATDTGSGLTVARPKTGNDAQQPNGSPASEDVSTEFALQVAKGHQPKCSQPWRTLTVDLMKRTHVCCSFFTHLPEFDWLPADKFHEGMWNHPLLQYLRETMGTEREVPFCTFCKAKNKRAPVHAEERAQVSRESLRLFDVVLDTHLGQENKGDIDSLDTAVFSLPGVERLAESIVRQKDVLRNYMRRKELIGKQNVAVINGPMMWIPFLAERNDHVSVFTRDAIPLLQGSNEQSSATPDTPEQKTGVNPSPMEEILRHCRLDNVVYHHEPSMHNGQKFNVIIVDPRILAEVDRDELLGGLKGLLADDGVIHITGYRGPGALLLQAVEAKGDDPGDDTRVRVARVLERGSGYGGPENFGTLEALDKIVRDIGLAVDKTERPACNRIGGSRIVPPKELQDPKAIATLLLDDERFEEFASSPQLLHGIERTLTFRLKLAPALRTRIANASVN